MAIDDALLGAWPLPAPADDGDKSDRGRAVCLGGAPELPGAIILAGTAALRAGAGTLRIGTGRSIAQAVAVAVPEALVFGVAETRAGAIAPHAVAAIAERVADARAVLIGPGMVGPAAAARLLTALLPHLEGVGTLLLDAVGLDAAAATQHAVRGFRAGAGAGASVIMTPHAGEMARLLATDLASVAADPVGAARHAASHFNAVVTLKGADTYVATPGADVYCYRDGGVGLATSGSGDTLAGVVAGLAARGADPAQAAVWGVYLHGEAGNRLTARIGRLGFLARELLAEVPCVMAGFDRPRRRRARHAARPDQSSRSRSRSPSS